jgi:uncharacterized protein YlxW (UPF0749 family)
MTAGLLAGMLLTWQFLSKAPLPLNFPSEEVKAKEDLLKSYLDEQSYLMSKIVSLRKDVETAHTKIEDRTQTANFSQLDDLKRDMGLTTISGPGLEITLDDGHLLTRAEKTEITDTNLVQASDLRDVVNILNASKADAISINDQRIIANSPISSVGTTILVNNSHIAPPFVINAIGDSEMMLQRLLNKNLLLDIYTRRAKSNIGFEIAKKAGITIGIYNGDLKSSHLNPVKK